ncbi:MAG: glycosyltransferase family 2 protein [Luteimonas sp.]|nr:glycosyltransferase family 2 protein [Luteimonas sp.]
MTGGICVVVVSHESLSTIEDCLARLRAADGVEQIRVVDNGSGDGTLDVIQRAALADPRLHFIGNPDNPGFSVACNQGARDGDAPWLAFVNPDCLVEPDALARLLAHAQSLGGEVVVGAELVDEAGVADPAVRRRDPDFAAMLSSRAARELSLPVDDGVALQPVDAISGAVMLLPRALYERIGGFDEGYRLHAEDLDLCRRARAAGALIVVANDVRIVHLRGVSSRSRPVFVEWHKHKGLWRYFRKFEAPRRSMSMRFAVWCAIWARFPFAALRAIQDST